ncbi:MAG: oligosaccharide flippase family protein [Clostridia bacterium]|nr:oligosaccharide flippase family protein [Clostridia bacterium]
MAQSLKRQTLILTLANAYTRALGFILRLLSARLMGAEALGVMELSSSAIMLAITPVTAGIPSAISRLTAQPGADERAILRAGLTLVKRLSLALIPLMLLLAPGMAWLLGDWRTLPSILTSAPAILLLGLCAVYSGWFCGRADMRTPALNECAEQTVRCCLCVALLLGLAGRSVALTAALPGLAEIVAGVAVWFLFRRSAPRLARAKTDPRLRQQVLHLAAPITAARLCQTVLRALNAVLLPVCLRRSGLTQAAATAQFGLFSGMAAPLMMLPGVVTGAMCTVAAPAVSRQEGHPAKLRRTMRQLLLSGGGVGLAAASLIFAGADFISTGLYSEAALAPLLRLMAPTALLASLQQVQFGLITGLGLQKKTLCPTIACTMITLGITACLCPMPQIRLSGAAIAGLASQLVRTVWNQALLHRAIHSADAASGHPQPCALRRNVTG